MSMVGLPRKPDPRPSLLALDRQLTILDFNTHGILHQCSLTINECKFSPSLAFLSSVTLTQNSWSWQLTSAILNIKEYQGRLTDVFIVSMHLNTHLMYIQSIFGLSRKWDPRPDPLPSPFSSNMSYRMSQKS